MDIMTLAAKISLDSKGFESGLKNNESKMKSFGDRISAWTVAKGQLLSQFATKASASIGKFITGSIDEGKQFDTAMSQVAATMGKTMTDMADEVGHAQYKVDGQMKEFNGNLEDFARFMGANTKFTATEAAQALNYMALAGYNTQQSMDMLPNVLNLASAGAMDLAKASDMVTDTQTAFGINAERTTQMVDEMAKAASTGNTSVEQLGDAFLVVGALSRNLSGGMVTLADGTEQPTDRIQEMTIALTAMANAGIKGSEAGTHLRNMLLKLSDPSKDGAKALEALGVKVFDSSGEMRSLGDIFKDLGSSMGSLTKEAKLEAIGDLFNTRDTASVEALLAAIENGDWDKIGESILDSKDAAQKMADTQLDNLEGDTKKWQSALSDFRIEISKRVSPTLRSFVQTGTKSIGRFTEAFKKGGWKEAKKELKNIFNDTIKEWKSSENPLLQKLGTILEKVKNGLSTLKLAFTDFPAFMSKVWEGIKKGAADLGGLVFGKNDQGDVNFPTWDDVKQFAKEKWELIKEKALAIADWLGGLVFGRKEDGSVDFPTWEEVKAFAKEKWEAIKKAAVNIASEFGAFIFGRKEDGSVDFPTWDEVKLKAQEIWESIKAEAARLTGLVFGDMEEGETVFTKIAEAWKNLRQTIESGAIKVAEYFFGDADPTQLASAIKTIGDVLTSLGTGILTAVLVSRFTKIVESIKSLFSFNPQNTTAVVIGAIATALMLIIQNWDQIEPVLQEVGKWLDENVVKPLQSVLEWIQQAIQQVREFLGLDRHERKGEGLLTKYEADDLAAKHMEAVQAGYEWNGGDPEQQAKKMEEFYASLKETMENAGFSAEEIEEAIEKAKEASSNLEITEFLAALTDGNTKAEQLKSAVNSIPSDKTLTVHIDADDPYGLLGDPATGGQKYVPTTGDPIQKVRKPHSFAKGSWNVPYDNMLANLHRGEMVLTSSQARDYRDSNGGNVDLSGLEDRIISAIQSGMKGASVPVFLDGKEITDDVNRRNMRELKSRRYQG